MLHDRTAKRLDPWRAGGGEVASAPAARAGVTGIHDAGRLVPQLKGPCTGAGASAAAGRGRRRGPLRAAGGGATRRGLRDAVVAAWW